MFEPDQTASVRGTAMTRGRLATVGAILLVAGIAVIAASVVTLSANVVVLIPVIVGLVLIYAGVDRVIWAARRVRADVLLWLAGAWVVLLVLAAIFAPVLPLGEESDVAATIYDPAFVPPFTDMAHPLGTNGNGLDMLARAVFGARASLTISLGAIAIGLLVGGAIGMIAGFFGKLTDGIIGIFTNALLAIPPLILLIVLATILEPRIRNMSFALALLTIPTMIRLARANTIAYNQRGFVLAARSIGASNGRIMLRELLPNVLPPMMSLAVVVISGLIVAEASLSFLGLGIPQPEPTWGNMIAEAQAQDQMSIHPFILLVPGGFLFLTVFAFNLLGERAQSKWDPRGAKL